MHRRWTTTSVVALVLVGSVVVAILLARQAMTAAEQRQAVIDSMLRDYARLAAFEFIREATVDIERSAMHTIARRAHPENSSHDCNCQPVEAVDEWFEYLPVTGAFSASAALTASMKEQIAREAATTYNGISETGVRLWQLPADPDGRIVALRFEPHLGTAGGQMGFIIKPSALQPVLERTHRRAILLPSLTTDNQATARFVDLTIVDREGRVLFASPETRPGPHGFSTNFRPGGLLDLQATTSMTPSFIPVLGPEHGAGPGQKLIVALVAVNVLLVAIGIWQLARERELARLRANFVAGVSHELRTPLAQIRMFAETLMLDRVRSPHESRRAAEIIGRETRRLGQLVENVLYFHQHERIPTLDTRQAVDVSSLVGEVVEGFGPLAAARQVTVSFTSDTPDVIVQGSADGLRQVVLNLLDNAVKFGPTGQDVRVALSVRDGCARLIVEDQGPGIPVAEQKRIFNAFERGRETRGAGGAGIGLAVVSQIVHAHGGTVSVEAGPAEGSCFIVALPIQGGRPV